MRRAPWLPVVATVALAACAEPRDEADEEVVLRVGTSHGLGEVVPGPSRVGGAAYYIRELLYEPLTAYAEIEIVDGRRVILNPLDAQNAGVLKEALVFNGLESVELGNGGRVVATFDSPNVAAQAAAAFRKGKRSVATGPFRLVSNGSSIRLEANNPSAPIDAIDIQSLPTTELWRRLHGRDIDVIPALDEVHREQFEDMQSVRLLELPMPGYASLVFDTSRAAVSETAVRRRIASSLNRSAIAAVACGDADCKTPTWTDETVADSAGPVELPEDLHLVVLESDSSLVLAAEVIRHQLRAAGVRVHLEEVSLDDLLDHGSLHFDALLIPLPASRQAALSYVKRYTEVGAASRSGNSAVGEERLRLLFAEEVPAIPLFEGRFFAAVDGGFCGGEPDRASSWTWLAELHPCEVASR